MTVEDLAWYGGRSYSFSSYVEDDEGHWNGSWSFTRAIKGHATLLADLVIRPAHGKRKSKERSYLLTVKSSAWNIRASRTVCAATCESIKACKEHADKVGLHGAIKEIYSQLYDRETAQCWYTEDCVPFLTHFTNTGCHPSPLETGTYLVCGNGIRNRVKRMKCTWSGSNISTSTIDVDDNGMHLSLPPEAPRPWAGFPRY